MGYNPTIQTRTALTVTGFSTLASATYVQSVDYNCNTNKPADVIVEIEAATTNTPAGNKQVVVFLKESIDGVNYRTGPASGTTTTDEPDLRFMGIISINTASVIHRGYFSIFNTLGFVPKNFRLVLKNDLGVALTSGAIYTSEIAVP